jgi:hypothetical protein
MSIRLIIFASVFGLCWARAGTAETSLVWLAGEDPVVLPAHNPQAASDYMAMFQPDAPWEMGANAVQVFKTSTQFLASARDELLSRMFAYLKRRNIALGMEALMLTASAKCGGDRRL